MSMEPEPLKGKIHKQCIGFTGEGDNRIKQFTENANKEDIRSAVEWLKHDELGHVSDCNCNICKSIEKAFEDVMRNKTDSNVKGDTHE